MLALSVLCLLSLASAPQPETPSPTSPHAFTSLTPSAVTITGFLATCLRGVKPSRDPVVAVEEAERNAPAFVREELALLRRGDLAAAQAACLDACSTRTYLTGALTVGETSPSAACETCAVLSWMWLNQALLEASGDSRYGDMVEKLLWNHLPAARSADGAIRRYAPLNGPCPPCDDPLPECCATAASRALALAPSLLYATGPAGIYVNHYCASSATLKTPKGHRLVVEQHTGYPTRPDVALSVRLAADEKFTIFVRIPAWSEGPTVRLFYFAPEQATPGTYFAITRTWSNLDMAHLRFPSTPRWVPGEGPNAGMTALTRGPLVYILTGLKTQAPGTVSTAEPLRLLPAPNDALGPFYRVSFRAPDLVTTDATLRPFANLSASPPDASYATWLPTGPG